ncbi:MAG: amidohydrolase family protein [Lachnospiraceae bacterium]|nr:amidohydrolase family protein [Lachnospiraceae bacterium]
MKKIDAHAHIGNFGGWAGVESTPEILIGLMDEYEVEKAVLCARDHTENDRVADACEKYPERFLPLVYINPMEGADECRRKIEYYVDGKGFRGIKLNPLRHAFVADDTVVDPVMEEAEKRRIPVFIHSGHPPYSLPWSIAFLAERFPQVKVVMIHMGHGHGVYIDAALKMAKRYPNIYLEMSGMPMGVKIRQAYEEVGKNRIMFGTDFPFHHPSVEIQKVLTCGLKEEAQKQIFYDNVLGLFQ